MSARRIVLELKKCRRALVKSGAALYRPRNHHDMRPISSRLAAEVWVEPERYNGSTEEKDIAFPARHAPVS